MKALRRSSERGHADHGWLDTYHTFSFADYYDPQYEQFRALRVMNEDRVAPGMGFGMHPHRDVEILTYVLSGQLQHRDSMGNSEVLRSGEVQQMTAGTGILHSEFNPDDRESVHLYQIWILPRERGLRPSYAQKAFDPAEKRDRWQRIASPEGREGSLIIHQDANVFLADLSAGKELSYALAEDRHVWLQVLRGQVRVDAQELRAGDGLAVSNEPSLSLVATESAEVMLFDLP